MKKTAIASLIFISFACQSTAEKPTNELETTVLSQSTIQESNEAVAAIEWPTDCEFDVNPQQVDPITFLINLKYRDCQWVDFIFINSDSIPENWVKPAHLPILYALLNNQEIAYPVISIEWSVTYGPHGFTTIGRHAYHLLCSYKGSYYPNYSAVPDHPTDAAKLEESQRKHVLRWVVEEKDFSGLNRPLE